MPIEYSRPERYNEARYHDLRPADPRRTDLRRPERSFTIRRIEEAARAQTRQKRIEAALKTLQDRSAPDGRPKPAP